MSSALASYASGQANAQASALAAQQQAYSSQLQAYAGGPRKEVIPYLDKNVADLAAAYESRGGYIPSQAGTNAAYQAAIAQATGPSQAQQGLLNYYAQGQATLTPEQVAAGAQGLLNSDLINSQVDAYSRDIARNLGENVITGIRSSDIASGNLGSSRGGVQEAIARRAAEDRIADFRGDLAGQALQQSQGLLQSNISSDLAGFNAMSNLEQQQMGNLLQAGGLQQQLTQADLANQIGARDYDITGQAQLGSLLQNYAQLGNLVDQPKQPKFNLDTKSWNEVTGISKIF